VGANSGENLTTGNWNTFIGKVLVPNAASTTTTAGNNTSKTIILADGYGNQGLYIHSNGNTGIGLGNNVIPQNRLEVNSGAANASGLRFTNLNSAFVPTTTASKFLTVNASGDVVLQNAIGTGSTVITAGQNIVVAGDSTVGYTISSPTTNTLSAFGANGNTMTSNVNGVVANAAIVNTVVNEITAGELKTTVNGVPSTPITLPTFTEIDADVENELQTLSQTPINTLTGLKISLSHGGNDVWVDGSETIIQGSTTVSVLGNGTLGSPYIISSTATGGGCNIYDCDGVINGTVSGTRFVDMATNNIHFRNGTNNSNVGGKIIIGETNINFNTPYDYKLYVEKGILTEKVKVAIKNSVNWADYVFANDYKLMPLNDVEAFIKSNKHLPGVSSAENLVKEGLDLGEMQAKQMEKIEELTLYVIEQNKQIEKQNKEIEELKVLVNALVNKNK